MGTKLEAAGKTGVIGAAIYSGWGHMGFHWITPFHNIAGMLTESASARLATPMFLHPDQLRGGPRNLPEYESQTTMPSLWPGGWWRVRDIVEQQKIAAWATVDLAARNRETVLWNMYLKGTRQTERGAKGAGEGLRDRRRAARSADGEEAGEHAARLGRRGAPGQGAGRSPTAGSTGPARSSCRWRSPSRGLVRWMLGRTFYPDNTYTRDRDGNPIRPYDMSTDTFGEFMGVRSDPIGETVAADLVKLTARVPLAGTVAASAPNGYVLDGTPERQLPRRQSAAREGRRRAAVASAADGSVTPGDFIVAGTATSRGESPSRPASTSSALASACPDRRLRRPQAAHRDVPALRRRQHGRGLDAPDVRAVQRAVHVAHGRRNQGGRPQGQVRRHRPARRFGGGDDRGAGGRRWRRTAAAAEAPVGGGPDNTPPEYRSGFGADGVKALQASCRRAARSSPSRRPATSPIQRFGLPLRNVVAGLPSKEFWAPGSTLRVRFDTTHPLAYGMPAEGLALFMAGSQAYEVTSTTEQPGRRDRLDLRRARHPAERLAARRAGDREEGRGGGGAARRGQGRAHRLPAAAPRPDARHVQARVQRVAERPGRPGATHDAVGRSASNSNRRGKRWRPFFRTSATPCAR